VTDWHESPSDSKPCEKPDSISLKLECGNSAFDTYWYTETARILQKLSLKLMNGERVPHNILDSNGNTVGSIEIK
jgi:hypothetical protein